MTGADGGGAAGAGWQVVERSPVDQRGGGSLARLVSTVRDLQDRLVAVDAPDEVYERVADRMADAIGLLARWECSEEESPVGKRWDLVGRGHPIMVPMTVEAVSAEALHARVVFGPAHIGVAGSVHGGLIPLIFDEVFGILATQSCSDIRTAYLKVDYRNPTPVRTPLDVDARIERVEGRKVFQSARLRQGDALLAAAETLMVRVADTT